MESIVMILFCDMIQTTFNEGKVSQSIVKPISSITPVAVPGNYSFSLYCSIEHLRADSEHELSLEMYAPDGSIMHKIANFPIKPEFGLKENDYFSTIEIGLDARNAVIPCTGDITAVLFIDGKEVASKKLSVLKK